MSFYAMRIVLVLALLLLAGRSVVGQAEQKITSSRPGDSALFGKSLAISGDILIVGAPWEDALGPRSGAVYVYRYTGTSWTEQQRLVPVDGESGDIFGGDVATEGDVIVVTARLDKENGEDSGSAYVFRHNGVNWSEEQKLVPDDGRIQDRFGSSASISGDVIVIGAPRVDDSGDNSGAAYVFRYDGSTWVQEQKLVADDGAIEDFLGESVSVDGNIVVIGADEDDTRGVQAGAAYVFRFVGGKWTQEQKLTASDGASSDWFGESVSLSGDVVVIGSGGDDDLGPNSGSVYVFRYDGLNWIQEQKINAGNEESGDFFGSSVAITDNVIVVGASFDDDNGSESGSIYVFRYGGIEWNREHKLTPSDGAPNDYFGSTVAVSGNIVIGASPQDDEIFDRSGSVYVFDVSSTGIFTDNAAENDNSFTDTIYPNPTRSFSTLEYLVEVTSPVSAAIYDVLGRRVRDVINSTQGKGRYAETVDLSNLPNGVYFYRIQIGRFSATKPLTIIH
ncbi:MAG: hypothetical protein BMS9Abin05_1187 [Rhodothermia bacterium]|nr:MAG: hypothetical protein BMS9Abin05_1187 [Rhodothermia bacterium]